MKTIEEKSEELSIWFKGYLWIMILFCAISIIYCLFTINQIQYLSTGIISVVLGFTFVVGLYLMNKARKEGFYIAIGSMIILTLCSVIAYGFLNYHAAPMGVSMSSSTSWQIVVLSCVFHILLLLGFMSIKKNGKNAFQVLWK